MHPLFLVGDGPGLQAGQSSTRSLLLRRHTVVTCAECDSALSCWNKQGCFWKRHCLDGSMWCSKTCMWCLHICTGYLCHRNSHTPRHHRCWLFSSAPRMWRPWFPKTIWNMGSSDHSTRSTLCQPISDKFGFREVGSVSGCFFAVHGGVLSCICRCSDKLYQSLPTTVFLSPVVMSYTIMPDFKEVLLEGWKVTAIQYWFLALPLMCRDSLVSENLFIFGL